ncbi:membrane fusion protein, multidrug efflux system [Granulicella pectinivorans]|uniref:Membrane fusion protein, multidrug efflux system n=1 Tax=Granulicella pectinivorans TaxID=474950 RepID=A0A1I6L3D0_9BACT|nr:membrane fusion protein, multidrug efflux system [Granulicella pectinivorans]
MPSDQPKSHASSSPQYHDPVAALPAPGGSGPGHALPASTGEPEGKKSGPMRKIIIVLVIAAAIGGAIWKIQKNRAETAAAPQPGARGGGAGGGPTPVLVQPVVQRTVPVYLTALGTVTAYNSVTIKSRVDGQLLSVNVREGQAVKQGQLLAQIDPRPYQAAVAQAEGQLTKDKANAANMTAEAARYTALYQAGVISKESQQAQVSNSGQATGSIQADEAAIQAAKVNVVYTRITSPISGIVGLRTVDPGNIVHASDTTGLLLVTQVQPIAVIFTLPEDQLPQVMKLIRGGSKLTVEAYDRSETQHLATGTLLTVDNTIDTTTGTAKVKAVFPNVDNALFPNQFVNVRLVLEQRQDAIVVPSAAVQTATNGNFVYVVREGNPPADPDAPAGASGGKRTHAAASEGGATDASGATAGTSAAGANGRPSGPPHYVTQVPVKVDLTQGSNDILAPGAVQAGDLVVIDGQEKLKPNSRVVPTQNSTRAAGGAPGAGNGGTKGGTNGAPAPTSPSGTRKGLDTGLPDDGVPGRHKQHANGATGSTGRNQ